MVNVWSVLLDGGGVLKVEAGGEEVDELVTLSSLEISALRVGSEGSELLSCPALKLSV